jgi:hypothetical protein
MIYADNQYTFDFNMNSTTTTYPNTTTVNTNTVPITGSLSTSISGATLTTSGTGSLAWRNPTYTINSTPSIMKVECDAEFKGEVTIRGVKLDERLNAIEERLGILRPNNDLEGNWEKLKALGEEYRKLEKEILEKEQVWDLLKK